MPNSIPQWHDPAEDPRASYERHPVEDLEPLPPSSWTRLAEQLGDVLVWLTERPPQYKRRRWPHAVGRRALLFISLVRPDLLPFGSDARLARCLGISRRQVCRLKREFRAHILEKRS